MSCSPSCADVCTAHCLCFYVPPTTGPHTAAPSPNTWTFKQPNDSMGLMAHGLHAQAGKPPFQAPPPFQPASRPSATKTAAAWAAAAAAATEALAAPEALAVATAAVPQPVTSMFAPIRTRSDSSSTQHQVCHAAIGFLHWRPYRQSLSSRRSWKLSGRIATARPAFLTTGASQQLLQGSNGTRNFRYDTKLSWQK